MTIEAIEYTTVSLPAKIEYSFNNGNTWKEGRFAEILHLQPDVKISFRNMVDRGDLDNFYITGSCNLVGNCMSLIPDGKMYYGAFKQLFKGCNGIISVSKDFLPATTLASSCYREMFIDCTNLTTAPELPATTLAKDCYDYMFYGCSKLNYIKMLATDISAQNCLRNWVSGVSSTGTFVKNPAMTTLPTGVDGIPSGWAVVNDGEESGDLITFTVGGVEYQAEEGMTWEQYVNSVYNTEGFYIEGGGIFQGPSQWDRGQIYNDNRFSTLTKSSDTIINGNSYGIVSGGSGD